MKILVTQTHIAEGLPNIDSSLLCPLALAVQDVGFTKIGLDGNWRWGAQKGWHGEVFTFPNGVEEWHDKMLEEGKAEPFEFELEGV